MRAFLSIISFLFHPIFTPLSGTIAYFVITPKYTTLATQGGNLLPISILTIIVPMVIFLILKNLGALNSYNLSTAQERKYPLAIQFILLFLILYKVLPNNYVFELYYYFVGLLIASFTSLLLLFMNFKTSLHVVGVSGLFMYLINLSIHFELNLVIAISVFALIIGLVASSSLYLKSHSKTEIIAGILIGLVSQLLTVKYWL